jgi:hypothetical protein
MSRPEKTSAGPVNAPAATACASVTVAPGIFAAATFSHESSAKAEQPAAKRALANNGNPIVSFITSVFLRALCVEKTVGRQPLRKGPTPDARVFYGAPAFVINAA